MCSEVVARDQKGEVERRPVRHSPRLCGGCENGIGQMTDGNICRCRSRLKIISESSVLRGRIESWQNVSVCK